MRPVGVFRRRGGADRGNTTLEAALSLTVFLMSIFGILDLGRMVWYYNMVAHGSREGVRYAVVHGANSSSPASVPVISSHISTQIPGLDPSLTTITVAWTPSNSPGGTVNVCVRYSFIPIAPYIPGGPWTLRARAQGIVAR